MKIIYDLKKLNDIQYSASECARCESVGALEDGEFEWMDKAAQNVQYLSVEETASLFYVAGYRYIAKKEGFGHFDHAYDIKEYIDDSDREFQDR